jgi:hypothetical protein
MKDSREQLKSYDSVYYHNKQYEECNVKQRDHGHQDTVENNLKTWDTGDEPERSQNPKCPKGFDIEALDLKR